MTPEQLAALENANGQGAAAPTETKTHEALDTEALYKIIQGDWGNNYGHITAQDETLPTVTVELVGQFTSIDVDRADLVAVPFIGA